MGDRRAGVTRRLIWLSVGVLLAGSLVISGLSSSSTPTAAPSVATSQPQLQSQQTQSSGLSNNHYYKNSDGNFVHSPAYSDAIPEGATAQCVDGTYSFSQHRQGTCSRHGGVDEWLN